MSSPVVVRDTAAEFSDDVDEGAAGGMALWVIITAVVTGVAALAGITVGIWCCVTAGGNNSDADTSKSTSTASVMPPPGPTEEPKKVETQEVKQETDAEPLNADNFSKNYQARHWIVQYGVKQGFAEHLDDTRISKDFRAPEMNEHQKAIENCIKIFGLHMQNKEVGDPLTKRVQKYVEGFNKKPENERGITLLDENLQQHPGHPDLAKWPVVRLYGQLVSHTIWKVNEQDSKPTVITAMGDGFYLARAILGEYFLAFKTVRSKLSFIIYEGANVEYTADAHDPAFFMGAFKRHGPLQDSDIRTVVDKLVVTQHNKATTQPENLESFAAFCHTKWGIHVLGLRHVGLLSELKKPAPQAFPKIKAAVQTEVKKWLKAQGDNMSFDQTFGAKKQSLMRLLEHWAASNDKLAQHKVAAVQWALAEARSMTQDVYDSIVIDGKYSHDSNHQSADPTAQQGTIDAKVAFVGNLAWPSQDSASREFYVKVLQRLETLLHKKILKYISAHQEPFEDAEGLWPSDELQNGRITDQQAMDRFAANKASVDVLIVGPLRGGQEDQGAWDYVREAYQSGKKIVFLHLLSGGLFTSGIFQSPNGGRASDRWTVNDSGGNLLAQGLTMSLEPFFENNNDVQGAAKALQEKISQAQQNSPP